MNKTTHRTLLLIATCLLCTYSTVAQLKLPAIISDNMVLQSSQPIPLWGWATPGEKITITFNGKTSTTTTGSDSSWSVKLSSCKPGGPFEMNIKGTTEEKNIKNILIGEVWLASGQSNMEFGIQTEAHGTLAIERATDSLIRFFYVPMAASLTKQKDIAAVPANSLNGKWIVCSPATMAASWAWHGFSAAGYYFAQQIRITTGNPVGMIGSYKGGTPAQAWTSVEGLQQDTALARHIKRRQDIIDNYEAVQKEYPQKQATFQAANKKWLTDSIGPRPQAPTPPNGGFGAPANLFHAMIAPLIPYAIKGVIWYQGESNGDRLTDALEYATLFPRLIKDWRQQWEQGDFPFLFVQLTSHRPAAKTPSEGNWAWVREAQTKTLSLPNTGMAVITDIGDARDIHPTNKQDVGLRLAIAARAIAYHKKLIYEGPVYRSMQVKGNEIHITFKNVGGGLEARTSIRMSLPDPPLYGFGIAGEDGQFVWGKAHIEGNKVIVFSDVIKNPVAVRYNWADNPPGNLFNKDGLPAGPFRTDNWPPPAK
ncbi:MAG: sialate O-acetylesterase [Niastella sp.]|nr:sialate O-acetylesterase [Niastella sp.]